MRRCGVTYRHVWATTRHVRVRESEPSSVTALMAGVEIVRTLPALPHGERDKAKDELAS